tara:strand:+ start:315 stop:488 length:174 start_codon:yes stop_codon:yes gene_type:complete
MKSSNTSSCELDRIQKLSSGIGKEVLITSSTRDLVEFYWLNRKQFSRTYAGFPVEVK